MQNEGKQHFEILQLLTPLKAEQIAEQPWVRDRFIQLFNKINGLPAGDAAGEIFYETEKYHFNKQVLESDGIKDCTRISIYGSFMDLAVQGLSVQQGTKPLAYLSKRSFNTGTRTAPNWEARAYIMISPYGELYLRQKSGQIKYADNPQVLYVGDIFRPGMNEKGKYVVYEPQIPRTSKEIFGCFIRITRVDGSVDYSWMLKEEIDRLKASSHRQNARGKTDASTVSYANALYGKTTADIDPGFLEAKCIRHAFDAYPKLAIKGNYTAIETEVEAEEETKNDTAAVNTSDLSNKEAFTTDGKIQTAAPAGTITHEDDIF